MVKLTSNQKHMLENALATEMQRIYERMKKYEHHNLDYTYDVICRLRNMMFESNGVILDLVEMREDGTPRQP